jgi:hypothetical protein
MKRVGHIFETLISDENIKKAIDEVNRTHRWEPRHRVNKVVAWVESTKQERIEELHRLIVEGFNPSPAAEKKRWDKAAGKWRNIHEPRLYPDQYVHHILVQALQPVMMRGMDLCACGSIRGRGIHYGIKKLKRWMKEDGKDTKYCAELDIHHFYDSLKPEVVMDRLRHLIKDERTLDLCWRVVKGGVSIGAYTSQWFANTTLQPLDMMIHERQYRVTHYIRYMDNFTIFSPNKKALHGLIKDIDTWLKAHGMELKDNWQVFPTKSRLPTALGYRYGHGYTILRKRNLFRLKRQMMSYRKKRRRRRRIPHSLAFGLLSRLGQMKHCNSTRLYTQYVGAGTQKNLKTTVRQYMRKERKRWNTSSELTAILKS